MANYKQTQYDRVLDLMKKTSIFNGDAGNGTFKGKQYPFVLASSINNLYKPNAIDICDYMGHFKAFWNGELTTHPLSSQVACLNHLFPLRHDKSAVLSVAKVIGQTIINVLPIATDKEHQGFIQFEAISDKDHLNEAKHGVIKRGENCTSLDALIYAERQNGEKVILPIEWKYVESYPGNNDKSKNKPGETRLERYTALINSSKQLRHDNHAIYYFEPFYQLMRQTLWCEQMVANNQTETVQASDYIHTHIIPTENKTLLSRRYQTNTVGMKETWLECIINQSKYKIITPKELLSDIDKEKYSSLVKYLSQRYWD